MTETPNPFMNRGVVTSPDEFFGRTDQVNDVISRLRGMQSSSVVGARRIGKSSLLYHLAQTGSQHLGDEYRVLYFDLQDARFHTAPGFLRATLSKVGGSIESISENRTLNENLIAFSEEIDRLADLGHRIVLCLDEFENTFKHPDQFTEDFFDHMRAQLNVRKLAMVTATQTRLQTLSLERKLTSPFYTLFTVVEVGEFTEDEAQRFIAFHHRRLRFSDAELRFIVAGLESHPLKLQIECDWIIRNRERGLSEERLAKEIMMEYSNFFVGKFDPRRLLRMKRLINERTLEVVLRAVKAGVELL